MEGIPVEMVAPAPSSSSHSAVSGSEGGTTTSHRSWAVARVYDAIRTAHLERFEAMVPARVLYNGTRYDFDGTLQTSRVELKPAGRLASVGHLFASRYRAVELNEPLMTTRWLDLLAQLAALRISGWLRRRRVRIAAYCIDLTDPAQKIHDRRSVPHPVARVWSRLVLRVLVARFDRLAVGTPGTWELMADYAGQRAMERRARLILALPARCGCPSLERRLDEVLFVGAFTERKGIRYLLRAWDVLGAAEGARLRLIGKGELTDEIRRWAAGRPGVTVDVDPDRSTIHSAYRRAHVVVLPSQRVGYWREQVGLPIVEALAHGCEVVTTEETGLAAWLRDHGHAVLAASEDEAALALAISGALEARRTATTIMADLPHEDGRLAADRWMLGDA